VLPGVSGDKHIGAALGNHVSGWVNWSGLAAGADWHWDDVHSADDGNRAVFFTLAAGTHDLEIACREDGGCMTVHALSWRRFRPTAGPGGRWV